MRPLLIAGLWVVLSCGQRGTESPTPPTNSGGSGGKEALGGYSAAGGSSGGQGPRGIEELTVLSWNVQNLMNDLDDSDAPLETVTSSSKYAEHRAEVAAVILARDPDIAVLQEVENAETLDDLNAELGDRYPHRVLVDGNDPRGIDVAVLSSVPILSHTSHKDETFTVAGTLGPSYRFTRDCLEVRVAIGATELTLLGLHLRSKVAPDDPDKRLAEAQHALAIAQAIEAASTNALVAVLGDFNDTPDSPTAMTFTDAGFVDLASFAESGQRYSYTYQGQRELIDHHFASASAAKHYVSSSVSIGHDSDVSKASDHAPIVVKYGAQR